MRRVRLKRVYDQPARTDGYRVLVDRVWPRGVSRQRAGVDAWLNTVAPSTELRKWFDHDPNKWGGFKKKYFAELDGHPPDLDRLVEQVRRGPVTLVYSARDPDHNQAVALREYLEAHLED